jgi:peptidyl-prolyl cis-trans isomerase A (cyclophilin A)
MKMLYTLLLSFFAMAALAADPSVGQPPAAINPSSPAENHFAGDITLELDSKAAPKTVANFLQYVNEGFYNNTPCSIE